MKTFLILLALLFASPSMASQFEGKYRLDNNWDCKSVGADGGAIVITGNTFIGVESRCEMKNPTRVRGMEAMLYDFECNGEGETWSNRVMIMKHEEGMILINSGAVGALWKRCSR